MVSVYPGLNFFTFGRLLVDPYLSLYCCMHLTPLQPSNIAISKGVSQAAKTAKSPPRGMGACDDRGESEFKLFIIVNPRILLIFGKSLSHQTILTVALDTMPPAQSIKDEQEENARSYANDISGTKVGRGHDTVPWHLGSYPIYWREFIWFQRHCDIMYKS